MAHLYALLLCLAVTRLAMAYPFYRERIPNGFIVPHPCNPFLVWDGVGHIQMAGGGLRNPFGEDYAVNGRVWNRQLCELDSDLDGRTNGEELGDPDCTWIPGQQLLSANLSHPGICEPVESERCKNGPYKFSCRGDIDENTCPGIKEPDVSTMNVTFPPSPVPAKPTSYFCKQFRIPDDKAFHAIAFEPIIDNVNVLHHIALFGCRTEFDDSPENDPPRECGMTIYGCRDMIQVWSLGMNGYCLREGVGVPFGKGAFKYVAMQLHWTNPESREGWTDASGLRIHITEQLRPFDEQIALFGQININIPPLTALTPLTGLCDSKCTNRLEKPAYNITSAWLHMHYLGSSGKAEQFRNGEFLRTIYTLDYYDYDSPVMKVFETPLDFEPGDEVMVYCNFNSLDGSRRRETRTRFGPNTSDEMCFLFLSYYPGDPSIPSFFCTGAGDRTMCKDGIPDYPFNLGKECDACDTYDLFRNLNSYLRISGLCALGHCDLGCRDYLSVLDYLPCARILVEELRKTMEREQFEPFITGYLECNKEHAPSHVAPLDRSYKPPSPSQCNLLVSDGSPKLKQSLLAVLSGLAIAALFPRI